jgi:heptosyltransferase-2
MNRLVILAPNWLGDAVMALPAIADLRRAAPAAFISVAARPSVAPLFALVPGVNDTVVLGPDPARRLDGEGFDTALLLPNSTRAALVARRAGIPERWGYRTGWRGALLTRAIPPARDLHQVDYYQHLVHALGFSNGPNEPSVRPTTEAYAAGRQLLTASGWNGRTRLMAVAAGAAYGGAKRWPPQYFAELVDGLDGDGVQCVMIGAAADAATASEIAKHDARASRAHTRLNLVGRTDLSTLAGVLANCRGLVTNDSGAMHLAAAIGIPVTAMFGPTNEEATSPRTPNPDARITILTHSVWCRPCMLRECPLDHRCMRGIGVAAVLQAARSGL